MKRATSKSTGLAGALLLVLIVGTGDVTAACSQTDLAGTWHALGVSGDVLYGYLEETNRCKIRVSSTGAIVATGSNCVTKTYLGTGWTNITGGRLTVNTACAVTGTVHLCDASGCGSIRVESAQLERNKAAFPMIGYSYNNPYWLFSFHAVKR